MDIFAKFLKNFRICWPTLSIKLCWASQAQHHQLGQNKNSDFPNLLGAPPNFLFIFTQFVDYNRKVASAQYGPHWGTQLLRTHQDQSKEWLVSPQVEMISPGHGWSDSGQAPVRLVSLYFVGSGGEEA